MKVWGVTKFEKTIVTYKNDKNNKDVVLYDGIETITSEYELFRSEKQKYFTSGFKFIKCDLNKTLKQTWDDFDNDAKILKKETNGIINLYKSGNEAQTALSLFFDFVKKSNLFSNFELKMPDTITSIENEAIQLATFGALTYAEKYNGPGYKSDVISMYPSIMRSEEFLFPVKCGTIKKVKKMSDVEIDGLCFWRCEINESDDPKINKQFRFNNENCYTNIDIKHAKRLKLEIELLLDVKWNVIIYKRSDCVTGKELFGDYIDYLFPLKQKGVPRTKKIMNCIWGKLFEKNRIKLTIDRNNPEITEIYEDKEVLSLVPFGEDKLVIEFCLKDQIYKYSYARIGPFILSYGRYVIFKKIRKHIDHIRFLHTDGIISDTKLNLDYGNDIGDWRYEGFCKNCDIKNLCNKSGEFTI